MKDYEAVKFNRHAKLIIELNETLRINQMRKENNSLIIEQRQKLEESEDLTHRVWAETNKMGFNIPSWVAYFLGFDELPSTKKLVEPDMSNFNFVVGEYKGIWKLKTLPQH